LYVLDGVGTLLMNQERKTGFLFFVFSVLKSVTKSARDSKDQNLRHLLDVPAISQKTMWIHRLSDISNRWRNLSFHGGHGGLLAKIKLFFM